MSEHIIYGYKCELPKKSVFHDKYSGRIVYVGATAKHNENARHYQHSRGDSGAIRFNTFVELLRDDGILFSEALTKVILWEGKSSEDYVGEMEGVLIRKHDTVDNGFNANYGGYCGNQKDYSNVPEKILKENYTQHEVAEFLDCNLWHVRNFIKRAKGYFPTLNDVRYPLLFPKIPINRYLEFREHREVEVGKNYNGACALWVNKRSAAKFLRVSAPEVMGLIEKGRIVRGADIAGKVSVYVPSLFSYKEWLASRKDLLTVQKCASILNCSVKTVRRYIKAGKIISSQEGEYARVLVKRDDLQYFMDLQKLANLRNRRKRPIKFKKFEDSLKTCDSNP